MSTGLYNPKDGIINSCVYKESREETRKIKLEIKEILPVEHESKYSGRQVNYLRVLTELTTEETLRQMYAQISREEVKIIDTPKFFIVQYGKKPPILVNKENGRLYYIDGLGYDKEQVEHQAATLLSIWNRRGLVEGYSRSRICFMKGRNLEKKENSTEKFISVENLKERR